MATKVIEAKALLTADDQASRKLGKLAQMVDKVAGSMNRFNATGQGRMARQADAIGAKMRQASEMQKLTQTASATYGAVTRFAAPIIGAAALKSATTQFAELDRRITRIGITADAGAEDVKGLGERLFQLGQSVALPTADITTGLETLVAQGRSLQDSLAFLPSVAKTAAATGASVEDIAKSADSVGSNFKIAAKDMQDAFDIMAAGGKAGQFELKEMARYLPSLGPAAAAAGITGKQGLSELVAMLQVLRKGSGTSEEAATSASNIFQKIRSEETVKRFKKMNVDLEAGLAKGVKQGRNIIEVFEELVQIATKGDLSKIPNLINDMEFARGIRALMTYRGEWQKLSAQMQATSKGAVEIDLKRVTNDAQAKLDKLAEVVKHRARQIGEMIANIALPINDAIDKAMAGENPTVNRIEERAKHYNADIIAREELRTGLKGNYDPDTRRLVDARKEFVQREMIDQTREQLRGKVDTLEGQRKKILDEAERQKANALPPIRPILDARAQKQIEPIDNQLASARAAAAEFDKMVSGVTETLLKQAEIGGALEQIARQRVNADQTGTVFNRTEAGSKVFGFGPYGTRLPDPPARPISKTLPPRRPDHLPRPTATTEELLNAFPQMPQAFRLPPLDLAPLKDIKATVQTPIPVDVTGKVGMDPNSKAQVAVTIKVEGPGRIAGMSTSSSGNVSAEGVAMLGTFGNPDNWRA